MKQKMSLATIPGVGRLFRAMVKMSATAIFGEYSVAFFRVVDAEKSCSIRIADSQRCIEEFKHGLDKGCKYITILGVSENEASNTAQMLRKMVSCGENHSNTDYSIIINGLNPECLWQHLDPLVKVFQSHVIRCVVVPVQSLSQRLLALMHLFSDINKIRDSLCALRRVSPDLWISTHILFGFPSETIEDFWETLILWERLPFDEGQFFAYSYNPVTCADTIEGRVNEEEIKRRMRLAYDYCKGKGYACHIRGFEVLLVSKKPVAGANSGEFGSIDNLHATGYY